MTAMSSNGFVEIHDPESLNRFLERSTEAPVILFKHSNSCGVSALAYREMAKLSGPVGMITVQKAREVSRDIERRFELEHETPQVLIVRDGSLVWNASHGQVRAHTVEAALEAAAADSRQ